MTPARMLDLFGARLDDFAVQTQDGRYVRAQRPLTPEEMQRHLRGEVTLGCYVLDANGNGRWLCIDLDAPEREWLEILWKAASELRIPESARLREFSGSKGFHLWVFMAEATPGIKLARLGEIIREKAHLDGLPRKDSRYIHPDGRMRDLVEIYPKTTNLNGTEKGMGQLVKLPFGIHRKTGKMAEPLEVQGRVEPLSTALLEEILSPWENVHFLGQATPAGPGSEVPRAPAARYQPYPCTDGLMAAKWGEGGRNEAAFAIAKRLHVAGFSEDEVVEQVVTWGRTHTEPPLSDRELRRTARSGMHYSGMGCLNPEIVPFCKTHCPIWRREHPATAPPDPTTGVGPRLQVTTSDPPLYHLPLAKGWVKLTALELGDWERIRTAARDQIHEYLPRRRPHEWDRELEPMMQNVEKLPAPPEVSVSGVIKGLLKAWLQRASDDPVQVERRSVWRDEENLVYVFKGDALLRYVLGIERTAERLEIWQAVKNMGGEERKRTVPGSEQELEVWEIPCQ